MLPHHGRKNEALEALIAKVAPRVVLVSNRADEPRPSSAALAGRRGIPVYATGEIGTITIEALGGPFIRGERPSRL